MLSEVSATKWESSVYPGCHFTSIAAILVCPWKNLAPINVDLTKLTGIRHTNFSGNLEKYFKDYSKALSFN